MTVTRPVAGALTCVGVDIGDGNGALLNVLLGQTDGRRKGRQYQDGDFIVFQGRMQDKETFAVGIGIQNAVDPDVVQECQ